jgi:hypothetical protein
MSYPDTGPSASIANKKAGATAAVNRAQTICTQTNNREFVLMGLNYFCESFFINSINEKAIQAATAARQRGRLSKSALWRSVAAGLCVLIFQLNGLVEKAQDAQREYELLAPHLPAAMLKGTDVDAEGEDEDAEGEDDED